MIRRITAILLAVSVLLGLAAFVSAAVPTAQYASLAIGETLTGVDGSSLGAAFIDANSRTMVPLRALANMLELSVSWDPATMTASFTDGQSTVSFRQNEKTYTKDGKTVAMDTATVNKEGRVYAPARYLAEAFGYTVGWEGTTRTVLIHKNSPKSFVTRKSGDVRASNISFKTYRFSTRYSNYDVILFTNNSNDPCEINVTANYYDDAGNMVDTEQDTIQVLSPHTTTAVYNTPDTEYASSGYNVVLEKNRYYSSTTQNLELSYHVSKTDSLWSSSNIVGFVKNNGSETARFVEVTALLFKDGFPVGLEQTYANVTDFEIKPGEEGSFKCSTSTDFDSVELYLESRGDFQIRS